MTKHPEKRYTEYFTRQQRALVSAAAARIFPTTATPGATEAGAVDYIDQALAEAYAADRVLYRNGLRALNRHARRRFGERFTALNSRRQDAVLRDFERGQIRDFHPAALFFRTLWRHTLEGVFGEPSYGGNRDLVGWRLVGFPGQRFGYDAARVDQPFEPVSLPGGAFDAAEALA
jgi:gluconate 2-dehydrogenase gamma chain